MLEEKDLSQEGVEEEDSEELLEEEALEAEELPEEVSEEALHEEALGEALEEEVVKVQKFSRISNVCYCVVRTDGRFFFGC